MGATSDMVLVTGVSALVFPFWAKVLVVIPKQIAIAAKIIVKFFIFSPV
jgi:hypothetical protein